MKREKIIAIIGLVSMLCFGIIVIVNVIIMSNNANPLTFYEFYGFGIAPIVFSALYLQRILRKPKKVRK